MKRKIVAPPSPPPPPPPLPLEAGEEAADSKSIDQIEKNINDLQHIIDTNTGDTQGTEPEDLYTGGALNVIKTKLVYLQRVRQE